MEQYIELNNKEVSVNWKLIVSVFLVSLMVIIRDIGIFNTPTLAFVLVYFLSCIALPYKSIISLFFFSIPFQASIHGITVDIILVSLLLKAKHINANQIVFSVIILLLELIHLVSYSFAVDYIQFFIYAPNIILFFFVLFDDTLDDDTIYSSIKLYVIGVATIILTILFHSIQEFGIAGVFLGNIRIGGDSDFESTAEQRFTIMNANTLAYFSITALSLLLYIKKAFNNHLFKTTMIIIMLFAGVLSTSRTWLFLGAIIIAIYFLSSKLKGKVGFLLVALTLFIVAERYTTYSSNLMLRFDDRLHEQGIETGGGRTELFNEYNNFLKTNPHYLIFGTGVIYYKQVTNLQNSVHSGFQQVYLCYGCFGVVLYLICFVLFFKKYQKGKKFHLAYYMPFFSCLVFDQLIQFLMPYFLMLPFVATMLPLKLKQKPITIIAH